MVRYISLPLCKYICVYMYICTLINIYINACTHTHTCTHTLYFLSTPPAPHSPVASYKYKFHEDRDFFIVHSPMAHHIEGGP